MRLITECPMLFAKWAVLLLGVSAVAALPSTSCDASKYITVSTSNGPVTGHLASNSSCVVEYLGIPYAKPPVGDLRFAPPQKLNGSTPYEASHYGYDCPLTPSKPIDYPNFTPQAQRIISYFASAAGTPQSEDCLTLNIWSKTTRSSSKANKPVLVFFYGGRFTIGNTDTPFYNGKYFADAQDIVVVTVNYRLNFFGFPGIPGQPQNLGLRDQRAAVEWVRDNIQRFGGNPNQITISGQSSGGVAVDYWSYAHKNDPIAKGIIAHSGTVFSFPGNTPDVASNHWQTVVSAVGCADAGDVLGCVRRVDWNALKAAAAAIKPSQSSSVLRSIPAFWPVPDDETMFADYTRLTASGSFAKVPILYGNNNNEDGYYRIPIFAQGIVPTVEQVTAFLLQSFTCPVASQVSARRNYGVPSWAYRYFADWNNTRLYPGSGAYHGVDMHMIFGASEDVSGLPASADQKKLTKLMQRAWFSFVQNPSSGLNSFGWPMFNQSTKSLILLGRGNSPTAQLVQPSEYNSPCSNIVLAALGAPTLGSRSYSNGPNTPVI
ncbi:Para-nitrobenzyl esterase-like protein [Cladobotryum mycophilum]|uniref:Carboxylic ester hydrolase n=1 Tax=Cladobotryum mycophilum TaxID=491253 RepID=A0ABR0STD9_9HYPO